MVIKMAYQFMFYDVTEHIATITLNRPVRGNDYDYSAYQKERANFLIPLEIIYRRFLPARSSVFNLIAMVYCAGANEVTGRVRVWFKNLPPLPEIVQEIRQVLG